MNNNYFAVVFILLILFLFKKQYDAKVKEIKAYIDTLQHNPFNKYFLYGVIEIESYYISSALNPFSGARGIFQITKICCKDISFCKFESLFNYKHNVSVGIAYLQKIYYEYNFRSVNEILIAFYAGPTYLRNLQIAHPMQWYNYLKQNEKDYIKDFEAAIKKYGYTLSTIL